MDDSKYDLFIEYVNHYGESNQMIVDICLDNDVDVSKYENIKSKLDKSTIPFYSVPKILLVSSSNIESLFSKKSDVNIEFIDLKVK